MISALPPTVSKFILFFYFFKTVALELGLKWERHLDGVLFFEVAIRTPAPYKMYKVGFRAFKSPPVQNA